MAKITLLSESETKPLNNVRPLIVSIKTKEQLYSCYMPYLKNGGMFVFAVSFGSQSTSLPPPGSKIMILMNLPDDAMKKTVQGKVCWVTAVPTTLGAHAGVGVHFDDNDANRQLRDQIEKLLAGYLGKSETRTQTV